MSLQSLPLLRILQLLVILFCCETIYLLFVTPTSFIITFYYYDYRKRYAVSLTVRKVVVMIFSSSSSFCCCCCELELLHFLLPISIGSAAKSLPAADGEFDRYIIYRPWRSVYEGCCGVREHQIAVTLTGCNGVFCQHSTAFVVESTDLGYSCT